MTTNYHDPYVDGESHPGRSADHNLRVGQLDEQITANAATIATNASAISTIETEITSARGGETDLDTRLDGIDATIATLGTGDGDVTGPATNTDEYVPQWNGADSKTLKNGFPITTTGKSVANAADVAAILTLLGLDTQPYIIPVGYVGSPGDAAYLLVPIKFTVAVTFSANFSGSYAVAQVAATAETILTIKKNGTSCGTITFAISGTTGTFASSGGNPVSFAVGDTISVVNQATADATLADIGTTLAGAR